LNDIGTHLKRDDDEEEFSMVAKVIGTPVKIGTYVSALIIIDNFRWDIDFNVLNSENVSKKWKVSPSEEEIDRWEMKYLDLKKNYKTSVPHYFLRVIVGNKAIKIMKWSSKKGLLHLNSQLVNSDLGHMKKSVKLLNSSQ